MKNISNKTLIFYHFQLDSSKELNVTSVPKANHPITIKEAIMALPIDLSQGLYHFRFKSEMSEGSEKIMSWVDINNFESKVPLINGAVHIKILKLQEQPHNKVFHIEKIKKAGIIRHSHHSGSNHLHHDIHSAPKDIHINGHSGGKINPPAPKPAPTKTPVKHPSPSPVQPPAANRQPPPPASTKVAMSPPVKVPPTLVQSTPKEPQSFIIFDIKPPVKPSSVEENVNTFVNQFKEEQKNRQNERLAQIEFEETIKKWGYTDMKKINNTTTLLATLHTIWPEWESVSLTDMLTQEKVNSFFKKAVIKVHPDKNRLRHFKEKYLSKRIFELLNESRQH